MPSSLAFGSESGFGQLVRRAFGGRPVRAAPAGGGGARDVDGRSLSAGGHPELRRDQYAHLGL